MMTKAIHTDDVPADVAAHAARVAALVGARRIDKNALQLLPDTIRYALAFGALIEAFGFPTSALSFDEQPLPGFANGCLVLVARATMGNRWFRYLLGRSVPEVATALADAGRLMAEVSDDVRAVFFGSSAIFMPAVLAGILREMQRAEMSPPDSLDLVGPRLRAIGVPESLIAMVPESRPLTPRSAPRLPVVPKRPLFQVETLVTRLDLHGVANSVNIPELIARHTAGDWGTCAYGEENETALKSHRSIMSVFPATGGKIQIITSGRRDRTMVTAIPHVEPSAELRCTYVSTGWRPEPFPTMCPIIGVKLDGRGDVYDEDAAITRLTAQMKNILQQLLADTSAEHTTWTIWRSVNGIDFRPFDPDGQRVSAPGDAWEYACHSSQLRGLRAWFAVDLKPRV